MRRFLIGVCLGCFGVASIFADEIEGTITAVQNGNITISTPELLPSVGDKLTVFVEIPDLGKASVAKATISQATNDTVTARIDKATGTVKAGQLVTIQSQNPTKRAKQETAGLTTWGIVVDPAGDCQVIERDKTLEITVPGTHHNLNPLPGWNNLDAPRVLRDVSGDFTIRVRVRKFDMPKANTASNPNRQKALSYLAGGLLVWQDAQNYVRFFRAAIGERRDGQGVVFAHAEYFANGKLAAHGGLQVNDEDVDLALVRKDGQFLLSYRNATSANWTIIEPKGKPLSFDAKIKAGVAVVNSTIKQVKLEFEGLSIASKDSAIETRDDSLNNNESANRFRIADPRDKLFPPSALVQPGQPWLGTTAAFHDDVVFLQCVLDDGPLGKAGLQPMDVILSVGDEKIDNVFCAKQRRLKDVIAEYSPGDKVSVAYQRNGQRLVTDAILQAMPPDGGNGRILASAKTGNVWAMKEIGARYLCPGVRNTYLTAEQQNTKEGLIWLEQAIDSGCAAASEFLGGCYRSGCGVRKDTRKAAELFEQARQLTGDVNDNVYRSATQNLAQLLMVGDGVPRDEARGAALIRELAESGSKSGAYRLAELYKAGQGVTQDEKQAMKWYYTAAKAGHGGAQLEMGNIAYRGRGVKQDYAAALSWFKLAEQNESAFAKLYIGEMYQYGRGVPQDFRKAIAWYQKAASAAYSYAGRATAQYHEARVYEMHGAELRLDPARSRRLAVDLYRKAAPHLETAKESLKRLGESMATTIAPTEPGVAITNWGQAVDPVGDCKIVFIGSRLNITVPAGVRDFWYGRKDPKQRYAAPRVLQEVEGDFTVQVKVTADCIGAVGAPKRMARAAGLMVLASKQHYLRFERNRFINNDAGTAASWIPPLYDRGGERHTKWKSTLKDPFVGNSTWLRLTRSGQTITAAFSRDGQQWTEASSVPTEFPEKVQVGVLVINYSASEFVAEFEEFSIKGSANTKNNDASTDADVSDPNLSNTTAVSGWLGVSGFMHDERVMLQGVLKGGPAEKAGLKVRDLILTVDDRVIGTKQQPNLIKAMERYRPGDNIKIKFEREGQPQTIHVTLAQTPKDRAIPAILAAAEAGDPWAMTSIGNHYLQGLAPRGESNLTTKMQTELGLDWINRSIDAGGALGAAQLAAFYVGGRYVDKDIDKASTLYERARSLANTDSENTVYNYSTTTLAQLHQYGIGIPRNPARAAELYRSLADRGVRSGAYQLGLMYKTGQGVPEDANQAMHLFHRAARAGHSLAQREMGLIAYQGNGFKQDYAAALSWFKLAAKNGSDLAMIDLGNMYSNGEGIIRNVVEADDWYRKSRDASSSEYTRGLAGYKRGRLCELHGSELGHNDPTGEAIRFYRQAAKYNEDARKALRRLGIDPPARVIVGLGEVIDPDGDCKIDVREIDLMLTISIPPTKHDLSMDGNEVATRYNAPRVLTAIKGDFVAQVKVTADWNLGPPLPTNQNAFAAGLVVWDSEQQYLRHERILYRHRKLGSINTLVPPIYDRDNARHSPIEIEEPEFFNGHSTWLRMVRNGQTISTYISHDGKNWQKTRVIDTSFPTAVQIGVHAINASGRKFVVQFEDFSIIKTGTG